ncbi:MAG: hypothetical protein LBJ87_03270 [bacterium]|nr:hypothetical protein [bacterium]
MSQKAASPKDDLDASIEIFLLVVLGLFMVLFGGLLFGIDSGRLRYNPDSTYGLFLVIVSFQSVALGKTPFGDFRRSWLLVGIGFIAATVGLFGSFIPGVSSDFLRTLVGVILVVGGIALSAQLWISRHKARAWLRAGGVLRHLTLACGLVYALGIILGIRTLVPGTLTNAQTAVILLAFGISIFYLAGSIWQVERRYPRDPQARSTESTVHIGLLQSASVPLSHALLILLGIMLVLLGALLFPVGLGLLPFSPDGQFGVLLTIMAIQAASMGQTLGEFRRSWPIMAIALLFAGLGIFSSIVPGVLTNALRVLLGILNIAMGAWTLISVALPLLAKTRSAPAQPDTVPVQVRRLTINQIAQGCVGIAFGVGALFPGLIPGLIVPVILVIYGLILFDLVVLLSKQAGLEAT